MTLNEKVLLIKLPCFFFFSYGLALNSESSDDGSIKCLTKGISVGKISAAFREIGLWRLVTKLACSAFLAGYCMHIFELKFHMFRMLKLVPAFYLLFHLCHLLFTCGFNFDLTYFIVDIQMYKQKGRTTRNNSYGPSRNGFKKYLLS